ncbi:bifunctional molybdenum cofactor biosynthesis protein [Coniochaeta sp. 2T2.1]|nr:bifunctional molybdenum cofactor biosynthesis protein [Coniochaeta sp. 2T2.1]
MDNIRPLLLAGGKSTRMKSQKHLLTLPNGTPLYQHQITILQQACPQTPVVYVSLANDSPVDAFLHHAKDDPDGGITIIFDEQASPATQSSDPTQSSGPAQGLLSVHRLHPTSTFLVLAIDYPLITATPLLQLIQSYSPPVTCFRNAEGFCEPLVGVWSPDALKRLKEDVARGGGSPSRVVKEMGGRMVDVKEGVHGGGRGRVLMNVNTRGEWEEACAVLRAEVEGV